MKSYNVNLLLKNVVLGTDYGPGAPKTCCLAMPLWIMYCFDWGTYNDYIYIYNII